MSIWTSVMDHANFINHGPGWLKGGLCASYETFILDAGMLQMMAVFPQPRRSTRRRSASRRSAT
jgi:trimethylamine--corrinoid protein Co-methyltransferase